MNPIEQIVHLSNLEAVTFRWVDIYQIKWERYEKIFKESVLPQIRDLPSQELELQAETPEELLRTLFEQEVYTKKKLFQLCLHGTSHRVYFLEVKANDQVIGYAIWHWSQRQPTHVYQCSLYLLPQWHNRGIRTRMVYAIRDILLSVSYFTANTRKSENNVIHQFYRDHLKCRPCETVADESLVNPEYFVGYEGDLYLNDDF